MELCVLSAKTGSCLLSLTKEITASQRLMSTRSTVVVAGVAVFKPPDGRLCQ